MMLGVIIIFAAYGYIILALHHSKPRYGRRAITLGIYLYLISLTFGILCRLGVIHSLEPGPFSYIAMILIMSFILIREYEQQLIISENRFRSLVEQSPLSIQILNRKGQTLQTNAAWHRLWRTPNSDPPASFLRNIQREVAEGFTGTPQTLAPKPYQILDPNDPDYSRSTRKWLRGHLYPLYERDEVKELVILQEDITQQTQMESAMRFLVEEIGGTIGDRFFEKLVQGLAKIFEADYVLLGLLENLNTKPCQISTLAVCIQGELGANFTYSLADTPCATVLEDRRSCVYTHQVQQLFPQDHLLMGMGAESYVGTPLTNAKGELLGIMVMINQRPLENFYIIRTIFELFAVRAGAELQYVKDKDYIHRIAYEDYLTRLPNRAQFHQVLTAALHHTLQSGNAGALLMIDLDHFKTINDALGHDVGDEVLRSVARRLQDWAGEHTFIARLGGDEFVVLLQCETPCQSNVIESQSLQIAKGILHKLSSPICVGERTLNLGASIGVSLFPQDGITELDVLRQADMALYRAKHLGRGMVQVYHPDLQEAANDRLWLEEGLRRVIGNNELVLHFQPQVTAQGRMVGAEVLLRWYHPDVGTIPPDRFIPVAEETGLIHSIGRWVLEQSCQRLKQWMWEKRPFQGHLSVNVCPWQFARVDFVDQIDYLLETYQINPHLLVLEVTETALLYDLQQTIEKLNLCRSKGIKIALDDFGIGYSSLSHLKDLPIDILKIDKTFVQELDESDQYCLVQSILAISHFMKLGVVAEGIETLHQRDLLVQFGCEIFQGYLFSRPLPETDFLEWVVNHPQDLIYPVPHFHSHPVTHLFRPNPLLSRLIL
jgi:diguanylate cyclase (GGDEF)-like protein